MKKIIFFAFIISANLAYSKEYYSNARCLMQCKQRCIPKTDGYSNWLCTSSLLPQTNIARNCGINGCYTLLMR